MELNPSREIDGAAGLLQAWLSLDKNWKPRRNEPTRWPTRNDLIILGKDLERIAGKVRALESKA